MRLARPLHRMVAGVDAGMRRDRAEFADRRVNDIRVVHDIGVVAQRRLRRRRCARRFRCSVRASPAAPVRSGRSAVQFQVFFAAMSSSSPAVSVSPAATAGALVLVVGPSGAGKDTLMDAARAALAGDDRFSFARRLITRPAMAGAEDHDSCSQAEFAAAEARGDTGAELARTWAELRHSGRGAGRNRAGPGRDRQYLARRHFRPPSDWPSVSRWSTSPRPHVVLAKRLAARGRESEADIAARLAREAPLATRRAELVSIQNDRSVAEAAANSWRC